MAARARAGAQKRNPPRGSLGGSRCTTRGGWGAPVPGAIHLSRSVVGRADADVAVELAEHVEVRLPVAAAALVTVAVARLARGGDCGAHCDRAEHADADR